MCMRDSMGQQWYVYKKWITRYVANQNDGHPSCNHGFKHNTSSTDLYWSALRIGFHIDPSTMQRPLVPSQNNLLSSSCIGEQDSQMACGTIELRVSSCAKAPSIYNRPLQEQNQDRKEYHDQLQSQTHQIHAGVVLTQNQVEITCLSSYQVQWYYYACQMTQPGNLCKNLKSQGFVPHQM